MARRLRSANVLLERINDIDAECSEDDQEILDMENNNTENYDPLETDSNTDENEENISNVRRRRKRRRFLVSSDSENEEEVSEIAMDGTVWHEVKIGSNPGRAPGHNIFRETSGPTGYSKRNIMKGEVRTAFSVIIDKNIIELIRKCTEAEAFRVLGYKWELSTAKLYAFFAILYARGAYGAKNIDIALLWNKKWGPPFFSNTMSRHDFTEIMRFIRFDDRNQRNQRLQTDKFAMISEVWYKFIDNSQNCLSKLSDQMARNYSVKFKSRRWPLQVFFNILDLAGINAWVLYKETTGGEITRQEFLFQLAEELAIEYQQELGKKNQPIPIASTSTGSRERKTCQIRYCKDNKTNKICLKCKKYVCGKCTVEKPICKKCDENE